MRRFALYYKPAPDSPLAGAAAIWLGRDAASGATPQQPHLALPALTAAPRRYGFHATLKAPFRLTPGESTQTLRHAVDALAATMQPVVLPGLELRLFHGFLALLPVGPCAALNALAAQVVMRLDPLRAPLTSAERARRTPDALSPRQRALLDTWGYPHVMDQFQFHMTLSGPLTPQQAALLEPLARDHFAAALAGAVVIDALSIFGEDDAGVFHLLHRAPLG